MAEAGSGVTRYPVAVTAIRAPNEIAANAVRSSEVTVSSISTGHMLPQRTSPERILFPALSGASLNPRCPGTYLAPRGTGS